MHVSFLKAKATLQNFCCLWQQKLPWTAPLPQRLQRTKLNNELASIIFSICRS